MKTSLLRYFVFFLITAYFFPISLVHAQELSYLASKPDIFISTPDRLVTNTGDKSYGGSIYLEETFNAAKIGESAKLYPLRYNAFDDEMEVRDPKGIFYLQKFMGTPIYFGDLGKTYILLEYKEKSKIKKGYFVLLTTKGNLIVLLKEKITLKPEVKQKTHWSAYKPPTYTKSKDKFYYLNKNNIAAPISTTRKHFMKLFSKEDKNIAKYIKDNDLDFRKKKDLIMIVDYYNN